MKLNSLILIFLLHSAFNLLFSQEANNELKFKHLSFKEGLSQSSVLSIIQDKNGFLWFGTRDGLNKYDGHNFKTYRHISNDSTSLTNSYIRVLFVDDYGDLWVGTDNGLNKYLSHKDKFKRVGQKNDNNKKGFGEVRSIIADDSENLWVGTNNGLVKFNVKEEKIIDIKNLKIKLPIRALLKDSKGNLWVKTTKTLCSFDPKNNSIIKYSIFKNNLDDLNINIVSSLYEDKENNIWLGHKNGLALLNRDTNVFDAFKIKNNDELTITDNVRTIHEDYLGNLWLGTYNGVYILNPDKTNAKHFIHDEKNKNSLSQNSVYKITEDSKGDIWIGTYAGGINYYDRSYDSFKLFSSGSNNTLNYKVVSSIVEDDNSNLWIGTEGGGINFYDKKNGQFKYFTHQENNKNSLSSNNVKAIIKDKNDNLWVGTHEGGLDFLNLQNKTNSFINFKNNPSDTSSISNDRVIALYEDFNDNIWLGTSGGGVNIINKNSKKITRLNKITNYTGNIIYGFSKSSNKDSIYIAGNKGILKINTISKDFKSINYNSLNKNTYSSNATLCVFEDEINNLWIGTEGSGLFYYDTKLKKSIKYGITDGLLSEVVYGILPDNEGNIWLSTNFGLSKFNLKTSQIKNFDVSDGIQGNEFNYGAYLKSKNGDLMFGGANGLTIFKPNQIVKNALVPPVLITDILVNNKPYINDNRQTLKLDYEQNVFSFNFIALSFSKSNKNQYAYKLEGFDENWNHIGNRKTTTYTNIDAGTYIFKVKASNSDGLWNQKGTEIKVVILPAPWKTWWAYLAYLLLVLALIYLIRKYYLIRIKERNELKREREEKDRIEEVNALKLKLFTNISHDLRSPLTLIISPLKKLIQEQHHGDDYIRKQHNVMHRNAMVLLQLINQLLDFRKNEAGQLKLEASKNNIVVFTEEIKLSFEEYAKEKEINFSLKSTDKNINVWFDSIKLKKIFYNLLSNAFKNTDRGGSISIHVSTVKKTNNSNVLTDYVKLEIEDTGKGISKDNLKLIFDRFYQLGQKKQSLVGTGIGLALTKNLVDLHKGIIEVNSIKGEGSCFAIFLPLGNSHLSEQEIINEENSTIKNLTDFDNPIYQLDSIEKQANNDKKDIKLDKALSTLLIVEDNPGVRAFVKNIFHTTYNVLESENGKEALEKAKLEPIDLIISDVMMPIMDGIEFCKNIKIDIKTSHIPVILLTAKTSNESIGDGYKTGADAYITKPFDPSILKVRVENLIQSRKNLINKFKIDLITEPKELAASTSDELFLEKAFKIVEENLTNPGFSVHTLANELHMSRSVLYRKIKALTDQSISEFIRTIKLKRAAQLIISQTGMNISEIAYDLGFNDLKNFRKSFKKLFKELPSQYRISNSTND